MRRPSDICASDTLLRRAQRKGTLLMERQIVQER